MSKAHRLVYDSTLGSIIIKKKIRQQRPSGLRAVALNPKPQPLRGEERPLRGTPSHLLSNVFVLH